MIACDIRPPEKDDLDAIYDICLRTGNAGTDARALYKDPELLGHIYAGPYLVLDGALALVASDGEGVLGYAVGALDTRAFEQQMRTSWWPRLQRFYREPEGQSADWTADDRCCHAIHHPVPVPDDVVRSYPAHIHMNLLPRARGQGLGSSLFMAWRDMARSAGAEAVHAGVATANSKGLAFWLACGFRPVRVDVASGSAGETWCGLRL